MLQFTVGKVTCFHIKFPANLFAVRCEWTTSTSFLLGTLLLSVCSQLSLQGLHGKAVGFRDQLKILKVRKRYTPSKLFLELQLSVLTVKEKDTTFDILVE